MSQRTLSPIVGVLAILLGLWTGCGGCSQATSSLSPTPQEPDLNLLGAEIGNAVHDLMIATSSLQPIDGAIAALATLAGLALVVGGILALSPSALGPLFSRAAFMISIVVDALQALWMVIWFVLVWGSFRAYTVAVIDAVGTSDVGTEGAFMDVAIGTTMVLAGLYFLVKIGLAALGLWLGRPTPEPEAPSPQQGLDWA